MTIFKHCFALLLLFLAIAPSSAQQLAGPGFRSPVKEVKIAGIVLEGNKTVDKSLVIRTLQVEKGEEYLPPVLRQKVQASVTALNKLGLFSDIKVDIDYPDSVDGAILTFTVSELPTLARAEVKGNNKIKKDDIKEVMDLLDGQVYSRGAVERNRQKILDLYHNKGYLLAQVDVEEGVETETGRKTITFKVDEGKKVRVRYITFAGNTHVKDKLLRKKIPTKEDRWWRDGDFKEDEYRLGLDTLVDYYRELGYLDASVQGEKITYTPDKKWMDVRVNVEEGKRYRFGKATFIHNNIIEDAALKAQVLLDSGEIFNMKKFEATKFQVQSLFREEGYLFMDMQDQFTYRDTVVDVTFSIKENSIAHIHLVDIRGNTKTKDKVIRREVKLFPGDIFRQSLIMRAQRDIMQLAFFDNVEPNIEQVKDGDPSDVNLVMKVTEKQAGTGTVSAGLAYSQRDALVGTVGLQIPNFLGNGQRADFSLEWGPNKQLGSIGFTEPWFLDTPTLVGGSIFYSYQAALRSIDHDYTRYGLRLNLGRRLTWPDDYFTVSSSYNLTENDNGLTSNKNSLIIPSGLESSLHLTLTRDDKNLPFFPSEGSLYRLTYSRVGGQLGGDFDYHQIESKVNWWFPTVGKLVLGASTEFGMLLGGNIQSYDLFQMGGVLGYQGKMRGYDPGSIGSARIGRSYFSFVTELTYPVVENTFYLLGFYDVGNVFGNLAKFDPNVAGNYNPIGKSAAPDPWEEIDFSDLRRDFGFGFRLVIPLVAPFGMGFDFGWPLDDRETYDGARVPVVGKAPVVNFVIEQGF
ncbi:MAG: outer membrane protein assembly complex, YaeT protein [Fibrobacteres bacterium]|nr:outer membrane protein assembly complex, YaeT protein [Fibrobacterota bacterium]